MIVSIETERPTIGILIPYFNEGPLLTNCLNSLVAQTDPPEEIWIYDDGSKLPPDEFVPKGLNLRIVRGSINRGPGFARNQLLRKATTQYVHFHDADDAFADTWCARIRAATETKPQAIFTELSSFSEGVLVSPKLIGLERLRRTQDLTEFCIWGFILPSAASYRREVVERLGGFDETLHPVEDYIFHLRFALQSPSYVILDEALAYRNNHPNSISMQKRHAWVQFLEAIEKIRADIPANYLDHLAGSTARAGSQLFRSGAFREASRGFALAKSLGVVEFRNQSSLYKRVAGVAGPMAAEVLALCYRKLVPRRLRKKVHRNA